ncbi:MAG: carbohydrate binding domain-containing protein [Gemmatales bacterium]
MIRFCVVLLSLFIVHVAAAAVPEEKNLVKNPGFEDVKDGKPEGWVLGGFSEGGKGTLETSSEKPHGGKACAHIKGNGDWGTFVSTRIPVEKGKTYALKGYVRVGKGNALIKFDYFKGDMYIGMTSPEFTESTDWAEVSTTSELSTYPEATHIAATLVGGGGEYEAWFDDVSIVEKK